MGKITIISCKKCDYAFELHEGRGFVNPVYDKKHYEKARKRQKWAEKLFKAHPEGRLDTHNELGRCTECGEILPLRNNTFHYELTEQGKAWQALPEDERSELTEATLHENYTQHLAYAHKCPKCGGRAEILAAWRDDLAAGTLQCPRCKSTLQEEEAGLWD